MRIMEDFVKKRWIIFAFCAITLAISVAAKMSWNLHAQSRQAQVRQARVQQSPPIIVPDYIVYGALFHHVVAVKQQADQAQSRGEDADSLRSFFQRQLDLSQYHSRKLDEVASECVLEVAEQDDKAKKVIQAFKTQYPPGGVKAGKALPPPPAELQQMQAERNAIILRARDRLSSALGDKTFQNVDRYVTNRIAPAIRPAPLQPRSAAR